MELEATQHIITFEVIFAIFTLIIITTEEIEGNDLFCLTHSDFENDISQRSWVNKMANDPV